MTNSQIEKSDIIKQAIYFTLGVTYIFISVYFGAVTPGGVFGIHMLSTLLTCLWMVKITFTRELYVRESFIFIPLLIFVIILFVSRFFSIYMYTSNETFLNYLSYFLIYCVIVNNFSFSDIKNILRILIYISVPIATFGLVCYFLKRYDLFFYTKIFYKDRLNATFINPNHFACYLNFIIPCVLFYIYSLQGIKRVGYFFLLILLFLTLVLTFSHSGIIGLLTGMLFFMFLGVRKKIIQKKYITPFIVLIFFTIIVFIAHKYSNVDSHLKFQKLFSYGSHWLIWKGCIAHLQNTLLNEPVMLLIGYGLGTFSYVYNKFHPILSLRLYEYAHNDYLQILCEIGLIGIISIMVIIFWILCKGNRRAGDADKEGNLLHLCIVTSLVCYFVHLLFDFNFYIPANALLFFCFIAFLDVSSRKTFLHIRIKSIAIILIFFIACMLLFSSFCSFFSRAFLNRAIQLAHQEDFDKSQLYFEKSLRLTPLDAEIYYEFGEMYFFRARNENNKTTEMEYLQTAQKYFIKAIDINAYNAKYYMRLADLYSFSNDFDKAEMNLNKVESLAPNFILFRLKKIKIFINPNNQQYEKALDEITFILDNFHTFTFQNRQEKEHLLYGLRAHLEKTPRSQRFYDLKERIFNELKIVQNELYPSPQYGD